MPDLNAELASTWATPWQPYPLEEADRLPANWQVWQAKGLNPNNSDPPQTWHYLCVQVQPPKQGKTQAASWYLYALAEPLAQVYVLGVFDCPEQMQLFLNWHAEKVLKVPALQPDTPCWPPWCGEAGAQQLLPYAGTYRVGFKSYRVEPVEGQPQLRSLTFMDRYFIQALGEAPEKEACLLLFSHFDARLRGCKMC